MILPPKTQNQLFFVFCLLFFLRARICLRCKKDLAESHIMSLMSTTIVATIIGAAIIQLEHTTHHVSHCSSPRGPSSHQAQTHKKLIPRSRSGKGSKFCPKYPVRNVRGRKKMVARVSCFMLSFW